MSLYFLLRTALIAGVVAAVAGVVSIGFIIATVVVIIVCLLIVGVFKRRKNLHGKDYTTTAEAAFYNYTYFVFTVVFSQLPLTGNNLPHVHVQRTGLS